MKVRHDGQKTWTRGSEKIFSMPPLNGHVVLQFKQIRSGRVVHALKRVIIPDSPQLP